MTISVGVVWFQFKNHFRILQYFCTNEYQIILIKEFELLMSLLLSLGNSTHGAVA